jgi:hypothetical protein
MVPQSKHHFAHMLVSMDSHEGQKVKYRHYRRVKKNEDESETIDPRGGATIAYRPTKIGTDQVNAFLIGVSYCNPKDNYQRTYGRAKALGRLVQLEVHGKTDSYEDDKHIVVDADDETTMLALSDAYMDDLGYSPR